MRATNLVPLPPTVDREVGARIRQLRRARGLSLETVAGAASLSVGFLSQIERGLSSPSLKALAALADAFGVPLSAFFSTVSAAEGRSEVVTHADERPNLQLWRAGIAKQLLTPANGGSGLNVFMVILAPGADTGSDFYSHRGEEAGLVLEGAMQLTIEHESWRVAAGDSFRFRSDRPHRFANAAPTETRIIWINALIDA
jgi:transcriptional regulator with XRE-family HTH domain